MTTLTLRNERTIARDLAASFLASILVALTASLSLKIPFTPVPLTLQMNVILFLAALMGSRRGPMMVLFFLMQGVVGCPVFALGASGIAHLVGPRGGYLIGYLVASFVVGKLQEECQERSDLKLFIHMGIGNLIVYLLGFSWLSQFLGVKGALMLGVFPFVLGDTIKLLLFSKLNPNRLQCRGL